MKTAIFSTAAIAILPVLSLAQDTAPPASSPAKSDAGHDQIEVFVQIDEALKEDFIPIIVTVRNNGAEPVTISLFDTRNSGVTIYSLDKSGNPTRLFPPVILDSLTISSPGTISLGPNKTYTIRARIPTEFIGSQNELFAASVEKWVFKPLIGDKFQGVTSIPLFSKPFSIPSPSSK